MDLLIIKDLGYFISSHSLQIQSNNNNKKNKTRPKAEKLAKNKYCKKDENIITRKINNSRNLFVLKSNRMTNNININTPLGVGTKFTSKIIQCY